jgi:BirA family transcriptional regulator, biotin operon repressor / biotin---[acetyl-CoA-carboxylase] ligase
LIVPIAIEGRNKFNLFGQMDTLFIGQNHIHLNEVDSTNSYAITMLKNVNLPEGSLITCSHQTNGRGQRGSSWESQEGLNATFSLVLKPLFLPENKLFYLSKCCALAMYDVITQQLNSGHFDIKIKWPNDILVNRKKICGMLLENSFSGNRLLWCVAGMGLNVNQTIFSDGINATSLKQLQLVEHDSLDIIKRFCTAFERYYLLLKNKAYDTIDKSYFHCLFCLNEQVELEINGEFKSCYLETVTESGLLALRDEQGNTGFYDVKEVKWLSSNFIAK